MKTQMVKNSEPFSFWNRYHQTQLFTWNYIWKGDIFLNYFIFH